MRRSVVLASIMIRSVFDCPFAPTRAKILLNTPKRAPANEPIVYRLVRAYSRGASRQRSPFLDHNHDPLTIRCRPPA